MPGLLNWPPSRGPNPHNHGSNWIPNATSKDLPAPKPRPTAVVEKDLITTLEKGELPKAIGPLPKPFKFKRLKERKKPLLMGNWKVWYPVKEVGELTLEQADTFVLACPDKPRHPHNHLEDWFDFEPRPLWVDITYPLGRGVRLVVKPLVRESLPCKGCGDGKTPGPKRIMMSPGYFLWIVAKEYERIYKEHEKYGVWGHALDDLGFERIVIDKDGIVELGIGS